MTLAPNFTCDYDSQITVSASTNVTIHGNGAKLDAAHQGRFFNVSAGATLALDNLVLLHGISDVGVNQLSRLCSVRACAALYFPPRDFTTFLLFSNFSVAF